MTDNETQDESYSEQQDDLESKVAAAAGFGVEEPHESVWPWYRDSAETMKAVQDLLVETFTELNRHGAPPTRVSVGWERPEGPRFQMTVMPAAEDEE